MNLFLVLWACALAATAPGFVRFLWFIGVGYGLAITSMSVALAWMTRGSADLFLALHLLLLFSYGMRLGLFLWNRGAFTEYGKNLDIRTRKGPALARKIVMWLTVTVFYVFLFSPVIFHSLADQPAGMYSVPGLILALTGLLIEGGADWQKSAFKRAFPGRFCNRGLFARVRFPAYLGETLFWAGNWATGIPFYTAWWQWLVSASGFLYMGYIMRGAARRLEKSQEKRYGHLPEFQAYVKRVPALLPWT